jgi:hypothetical protein
MGLIQSVKSFFPWAMSPGQKIPPAPTRAQITRNLSNTISPVQLQRLRHDVAMWREAVTEAELAWFPHRVRMQRMYVDTVLNGHVFALMERRKDLTLLRDFCVADGTGTENAYWSAYFQNQQWFQLFLEYALDALFFGYSLIALGDIKDDAFPGVSPVRRWNISPDRENVTSLVYSLTGTPFLDEPYANWHIWVKTPGQNGTPNCGYGLFYNIALYKIFLRNTLGFNADFVELYAMPYRVGKTTKTTETERAELFDAIKNMGSAGFALIDPADDISFLETNLGGNGYQAYDNLEARCQKVVSKIILGHADATDSTPGKLGNGGEKQNNPVLMAMMDKQTKDGRFMEALINTQLLPKMRTLGFAIPQGVVFKFKNDGEKQALREREDASNKLTADIFQTIKNAGGHPDWNYFTQRTGIPVLTP